MSQSQGTLQSSLHEQSYGWFTLEVKNRGNAPFQLAATQIDVILSGLWLADLVEVIGLHTLYCENVFNQSLLTCSEDICQLEMCGFTTRHSVLGELNQSMYSTVTH